MEARNKARNSGRKDQYKHLRNMVSKLVKRDKIQITLMRLGKYPGSKSAWNEAKKCLGTCQNNLLPLFAEERIWTG